MNLQNLLVPTDFSDEALSSLHYALSLAKESGATLHVLHSYYIPINTIETDYMYDQALWLEQSRQRAMEEMQLLEEQQLKASGVLYECHVQPGPSMEDINQTIREKNIDLVVMGTYKSGRLDPFFGDLFTHAIRHAKAPVLLVPEGSSYASPSRVLFATDLKPLEHESPVSSLTSILQIFNPQLLLLHVHRAGEHPSHKKRMELERLQQQLSGLNPVIVLQETEEDVEEGILAYVQQHKADWLVAISHQYGLLEGFFHSSHTKKLARQTPVPLLVSHE
jgi:nucleotide-binding universal stress UspA family protein